MQAVNCLKAPSQPLSFLTFEGSSAEASGDRTLEVGLQEVPSLIQPKSCVVFGQMMIFLGLNVKPDNFALFKTSYILLYNSSTELPRT